jgi:hypothetical protein
MLPGVLPIGPIGVIPRGVPRAAAAKSAAIRRSPSCIALPIEAKPCTAGPFACVASRSLSMPMFLACAIPLLAAAASFSRWTRSMESSNRSRCWSDFGSRLVFAAFLARSFALTIFT